jgi:hypothetical protein
MNDVLAWALQRAREQTLSLVMDIGPDQSGSQSVVGERHPLWVLGHLLLGDTYLLGLLGVEPLSGDFPDLLRKYGPASVPTPRLDAYDSMSNLVVGLSGAGARRVEAVRRMTPKELGEALPDPVLAQAQPTMAHHLHALVCHEGYHAGQLSAWRRAHGFPPTRWAFAPK